MQYVPQHRVILAGPAPYSGIGKGNRGSIIVEIDNACLYPRVIRLQSGNELKITKSNFEKTLQKLIDEDYILI